MSHLVFLESTPMGNHALAYAREKGHRTTLLWSARYDFFLPPDVRSRALSLADLAIEVDDLANLGAVRLALESAGITELDTEFDAVLTVLQFCVIPAARLAQAFNVRGPSAEGVNAAKD